MSHITQVILGETFGTFMLILLGNSVSANVSLKKTNGNQGGWTLICIGWGFAVTIAALLSGISGAHLNPAVTIGFLVENNKSALNGNLAYAPLYIVCQLIGAMLGQLAVYLAYYKQFENTKDPNLIISCFSTSPNSRSYIWNTITEIIGTFVLIMVVSLTTTIPHLNPKLANLPSYVGPFIVGTAVMVIGMAIGGPTGFAINPARDLGPRIMHAILPIKNKNTSDWKYAPVPVIGPIIGACIAGGFVQLVTLM